MICNYWFCGAIRLVRPYSLRIVVLFALLQPCVAQEIPDLGHRRELFVDNYLIEHLQDARLVLHEPVDAGLVLTYDNPWEGAFCGYSTVIKDSGVYRLYYRGLPKVGQGDGSMLETTCYAESHDGVHWNKPDLGLFEILGSRRNNVVLADAAPATHNFSPFLDTKPGIAATERYKALAGTEKSGLLAYISADGLHWRKLQDAPVLTGGMFDSQNVAFWSEAESCYVCYFRTWTGGGYNGFRTVSRSTSQDFLRWSPGVEMSYGDTPREHIYINQTHPYFRAPHIYIAVAARFMPGRQVLSEAQARAIGVIADYFKDCSDAVLMTSRGGSRYDRSFMEGFIPPGPGAENWASRSNYPALNVVPTGSGEMSIYVNRHYAQPSAGLGRYRLRLDGFASLYAPYDGGEMTTRPFRFSGSNLVLNFRTSAAGEIRVELQDALGQALPGLALADCPPIIGDEIERVVSWKEATCAAWAGTPVRLRLYLKDAHIFSFKFE